jgi:hypothetical protein
MVRETTRPGLALRHRGAVLLHRPGKPACSSCRWAGLGWIDSGALRVTETQFGLKGLFVLAGLGCAEFGWAVLVRVRPDGGVGN